MTKRELHRNTSIADLQNWPKEATSGIELRQDRDGRFYTVEEYLKWHLNDKWLRDESEDARRKLLTNQWKVSLELLRQFHVSFLPKHFQTPQTSLNITTTRQNILKHFQHALNAIRCTPLPELSLSLPAGRLPG